MAESQLMCMDDEHVNEKIPESKPEFYYSEEQRAAVEQLLKNGDGAFKMRLKEDKVKDFLSAREIKWIRKNFRAYDTEGESDNVWSGPHRDPKADSGVHSTYWPQLSDTEVPPLDIGWPDSGFYRGVTRVTVHTHPPKENGPHIKEVVRRLIQESNKVVAIVMDLLTDLQILQDLLDAASKRSVAVYIVLEGHGIPHFLDMCSRLQVGAMHLRNIRVRTVQGIGLALSFGKLAGCLCSKYMLVDGDKVMFGSYSFTWSSSRMDRNMITVMTGQVVETFDNDFRELYAISDNVDLYKEFHITKPPKPTPVKATTAHRPAPAVSTSRFQVTLGDSRQAGLKVPAHKYYNPKYSLVVGNSQLMTGSMQDLPSMRASQSVESSLNLMDKFLQASSDSSERLDTLAPLPSSTTEAEGKGGSKMQNGLGAKKQRSSFRFFLKGKAANQSMAAEPEATPSLPNSSPVRKTPVPTGERLEDSFEILVPEKQPKGKSKKTSKLQPRSMSLQAVNTQEEESLKSRKRNQKKACIQS
ncbi:hypothetical protein MATL_G00217780 [Megalops atlanticus]|uniref:Scaffolding anchor of CK1 domain-containing protein n=1 Tax=Megalops atlanticus TaxID=7932 RepID=A0A9D3PIT6_MEGAT|nr:hypothetical protein MATL_G00217780 [Megalops atlanticus]